MTIVGSILFVLTFTKSADYFGNIFGIFWNSLRILWEFFENSLGIIWEFMIFENERNLCFCQDFGVMQGRKEGQEFRSLEVRSKLIALKNVDKKIYIRKWTKKSKSRMGRA